MLHNSKQKWTIKGIRSLKRTGSKRPMVVEELTGIDTYDHLVNSFHVERSGSIPKHLDFLLLLLTQENSQVQRQVHMEEVDRQLNRKTVVRN